MESAVETKPSDNVSSNALRNSEFHSHLLASRLQESKESADGSDGYLELRARGDFVQAFMNNLNATASPREKRKKEQIATKQRERKRQINRMSAQRKREKEKCQIDELSLKYSQYSTLNDKLKKENNQLAEMIRLMKSSKASTQQTGSPDHKEARAHASNLSELIPSMQQHTSPPSTWSVPNGSATNTNSEFQNRDNGSLLGTLAALASNSSMLPENTPTHQATQESDHSKPTLISNATGFGPNENLNQQLSNIILELIRTEQLRQELVTRVNHQIPPNLQPVFAGETSTPQGMTLPYNKTFQEFPSTANPTSASLNGPHQNNAASFADILQVLLLIGQQSNGISPS